ncbi:MAG TPA: hypothetical protein VMP13_06605 [Acidimicrobiia bacterium]|nr:hypothetical protein [Acidimicrobiia bacterium]
MFAPSREGSELFVEYSTKVEATLSDVEKSLDRLRSSLEEWADIAYREGEQLRARVGPSASIAREVKLEIGGAEIHHSGLVYPIHWTANGAGLLFPELNADLILSKAGSHVTHLTLRGTYQPPLGSLGRLADRVVLGRVADATVADWMERLAKALSSEAAPR